MGTVLALASALSYGLSDVVGGLLSRRASFVQVALLGQVGGLVVACVAAIVVSRDAPAAQDLAWGGLSGAGTALGMTFLFRGMSHGDISIVVPVSAVGGVTLPVLVATVVLGERPEALAWLGIVMAIPSLWLASRTGRRARSDGADGIGDGLVASVGIAVQYLALAQAAPSSGLWPVAIGRVAAVLTVLAFAVTLLRGVTGMPRAVGVRVRLVAGVAGALAALALVCYLLAVRTQFVTIAVVLSSLYPVVPVLLGIAVLEERPRRRQVVGLAGALVASVLVATG